ncbi:MAG: T9SS type A sorting domain-containing protein [Bacteroidetes bacterium]|nr:T9SS type A sorting domain-containing protein [Bacteroidota bacterium]
MKRISTLLLLVTSASLVSAQTPGYKATSMYDDFGKSSPYADPNPVDPNYPDGIYWWGKDQTGSNPDANNTDACYMANKYALTRTGNHKLDVVVSQGNNCWQPMGISTKLDLSGNAKFEVSITNTSAYPIYFDIALVDVNKKVINCDGDGNNYNLLSIAAGETKLLKGDFKGGQHKVWPGPSFTTGLDLSKVIEIDFTIVNADQPESNEWGPLPITAATATINYVKIGAVGGVDINDVSGRNLVSVYPNPANADVVNFSQQLTNVNLYNTVGQLVLTNNATSKLDISTLSSGIYLLTSNEGVNKLIVE